MAKLIYATNMSLDGYIEDANGSFDWGAPSEQLHAFFNDLLRPIGTHLYRSRHVRGDDVLGNCVVTPGPKRDRKRLRTNLAEFAGLIWPQGAGGGFYRSLLHGLNFERIKSLLRGVPSKGFSGAKQQPADWDELEATWQQQLSAFGFTKHDWLQLVDAQRQQVATLTDTDDAKLMKLLDSPEGVTQRSGIFTRRDVVQRLIDFDANHGSNRLNHHDIDSPTATSRRRVPSCRSRFGATSTNRRGSLVHHTASRDWPLPTAWTFERKTTNGPALYELTPAFPNYCVSKESILPLPSTGTSPGSVAASSSKVIEPDLEG